MPSRVCRLSNSERQKLNLKEVGSCVFRWVLAEFCCETGLCTANVNCQCQTRETRLGRGDVLLKWLKKYNMHLVSSANGIFFC